MSISPRNKSGVTGVFWSKKEARWIAYIQKRRIGCFKELDDAVAARLSAEKEAGFHPNHGRQRTATDTYRMIRHQQQREQAA